MSGGSVPAATASGVEEASGRLRQVLPGLSRDSVTTAPKSTVGQRFQEPSSMEQRFPRIERRKQHVESKEVVNVLIRPITSMKFRTIADVPALQGYGCEQGHSVYDRDRDLCQVVEEKSSTKICISSIGRNRREEQAPRPC